MARISRTTKAAANLAYTAAFLFRVLFLPVTYMVHTIICFVLPLLAYAVAGSPFSVQEEDNANNWLAKKMVGHGLLLCIAISLFSPVIAIFTSIAETLREATDWGNSAYNFVAGEQDEIDEIPEATVVNDGSTAGLEEQHSPYSESKRNTMTHQRSSQIRGQVFEENDTNSNKSRHSPKSSV